MRTRSILPTFAGHRPAACRGSGLALSFIVLLAVGSAGCAEERTLDERLFGVWTAFDHGVAQKITFNSDGTFSADMLRPVAAADITGAGEYYVSGGYLVTEGKRPGGSEFREEVPFFTDGQRLVVRPMHAKGNHQGLLGYWSSSDGVLSYEFRGDGVVIRREILADASIHTLRGDWVATGETTFDTTFGDPTISGTLSLIENATILATPIFRR